MRLLDTYQKRRQEGQDLFLKNAKYIFNDHAVIVLFFLFGALAYQYSNWLSGLSQGLVGVWVHVIWAVLMTVGVFITGVASHIVAADLVFLLPMESKFTDWFRSALNHSLLLPSAVIILMIAASYPLLMTMVGYSIFELIVLAVILICFKTAHLNTILESWRYTSDQVIKIHKAILYLAVFITLLLASFVTPYLCLGVALLYLIAIHFAGIRPFSDGKKGWHWDKIVAVEQDRQQQIKRGLALFVNMPQDAVSSKRRKYLDGFIKGINRGDNPYAYLYSRAFWRASDYFPLWGRMTLVGILYLVFVTNSHWLNLVVILLIQYFSHFQILPMAKKINQHVLLQVYPMDKSSQVTGFKQMMAQPICTQIVLFAATSLLTHDWIFAGAVLLSTIILGLFFLYLYLPRFIRKKEKKVRIR
ncbi:ABC transporter permease [Aerococcus urinaeequi]|uniref:ABC transporter permease n=1 Tax=Aerococcus urinaeequi TaxID=51665 RepID=UPI003ED8C4BD